MEGFLGRYSTYIYAILRIVAGFLFMWHGAQKLLGYPPQQLPPGAPPPEGLSALMAVAGTIELVGGALIMIGLFTGIAAFFASGLMAFGYFIAHFSMQAFLPIVNSIEDAFDTKLLQINATFLINGSVTVEASRDLLTFGCIRQ